MKLISLNHSTKYLKNGQNSIIESIKCTKSGVITESEIKNCFPNASKELITEYKQIYENFTKLQNFFIETPTDKLVTILEKFDPNARIGDDEAGDFGGDASAFTRVKPTEQKPAKPAAKKEFDPNKRVGGKDFGGDAKAMGNAKPEDKPEDKKEEKKGIVNKIKEFYGKVSEYMKAHPGQKMIIIIAALGVVMTVASAFPALGMVIKAVFGVWNMYKGSKTLKGELTKTKDKSGWKIALGILQIGAGIFSVGSVGADVAHGIAAQKAELVSAAQESGVNLAQPDATTPATPDAAAAQPAAPATPDAPAAPAAAPATPDASAVAPAMDVQKYAAYGASKAAEMQGAIQSDPKGALDTMIKPFAKKVGEAIASGKMTPEQGNSILSGFAKQFVSSNGGVPYSGILSALKRSAGI